MPVWAVPPPLASCSSGWGPCAGDATVVRFSLLKPVDMSSYLFFSLPSFAWPWIISWELGSTGQAVLPRRVLHWGLKFHLSISDALKWSWCQKTFLDQGHNGEKREMQAVSFQQQGPFLLFVCVLTSRSNKTLTAYKKRVNVIMPFAWKPYSQTPEMGRSWWWRECVGSSQLP